MNTENGENTITNLCFWRKWVRLVSKAQVRKGKLIPKVIVLLKQWAVKSAWRGRKGERHRKKVDASKHRGAFASEEQWLRERGTRELEGKNILVRDVNPWCRDFWREHITPRLWGFSPVTAFLFDVLYFFLEFCFEDYLLSLVSLKLQERISLNSSIFSQRSLDLKDIVPLLASTALLNSWHKRVLIDLCTFALCTDAVLLLPGY